MDWLDDWQTNIRVYVYALSLVFTIGVYLLVRASLPDSSLQGIRLTEIYGFASVVLLYLSLLISPLGQLFKTLPYRGQLFRSRRAVGVSAFFFGWLHALIAFFGQLQGFGGLGFLSANYLTALVLGLVGLLIMTAMAITANDALVDRLGFTRWKSLHRLIYIGSWLIVVHVLMLGAHYVSLASGVARISLAALVILWGLEAIRFDGYLKGRWPQKNWSIAVMFGFFASMVGIGYYVGSASGSAGLGVHAQHLALAKQAQQQSQTPTTGSIPSLTGDATKRFSTSFSHPDQIDPNQPVNLSFKLYDSSNGNPAPPLVKLYDKFAHLVIVDNELNYYNHIHPDDQDGTLVIQTSFPHPGRYHLYLNVQPAGAIEQQFGYSLDVGGSGDGTSTQPLDTALTKTVSGYQVTLSSGVLRASDLSNGRQKLTFSFKDATGQPFTQLKPYLAAFGHLVMINQQTYDYIHVHPTNITPPAADANGGPDVQFLPLGLYGPIKPGTYRVFGQFNPNNQLIVADFTIKVEP